MMSEPTIPARDRELDSREAPHLQSVQACPACGSDGRDYLLTVTEWHYGIGGSFPLARCGRCGTAYLSQRPTPAAMVAYYPEANYYAYASPIRHLLFGQRTLPARLWYHVKRSVLSGPFGYRHLGGSKAIGQLASRLPIIRELATFRLGVLLPPFVPAGSLVEVGCGSGTYLDLMRALGWTRVLGVDLSPGAISLARERLDLEAYAGPLESLGLATASVDAASLSHTLEHAHDPRTLLVELNRVLRDGGRLAIIVPNLESLGFRLFRAAWYHLDAPRHLTHFTPGSLRRLVEQSGFAVNRVETSARWAEWTARFSLSRARRDEAAFWKPGFRAPLRRTLPARLFEVLERLLVAAGWAVGEEIHLVATKEPAPGTTDAP